MKMAKSPRLPKNEKSCGGETHGRERKKAWPRREVKEKRKGGTDGTNANHRDQKRKPLHGRVFEKRQTPEV